MFDWLSSWKRRTNERFAALEIGAAVTNEKLKAIEKLIDDNKGLVYESFNHQSDRFAKRFAEVEQRLQAMDDTMAHEVEQRLQAMDDTIAHDNAVGALSKRLDAFSTAIADLTTAVLADRAAAQCAFDGLSSAFSRHDRSLGDLRTNLQQLITHTESQDKDLKALSIRLDQLEVAHRQSRNHPPHPSDSFTAQDPALLSLLQQLQQQQALLQSLTQKTIPTGQWPVSGGPVGAVPGGALGGPDWPGSAATATSPQSESAPQYKAPYGGGAMGAVSGGVSAGRDPGLEAQPASPQSESASHIEAPLAPPYGGGPIGAVQGGSLGGPGWLDGAAAPASPQSESAPQYKAPDGGDWGGVISRYQTASGGSAGGSGMYEIIDPRTERVIGYGREG